MSGIRAFGVERIGALSDGVVAIALTLLVLEVKVPLEVADGAMLRDSLIEQAPELTGWTISFVMIALVWYDQHFIFAHSRRADSGFILLNLGQLAAVSLIPFGAHLLGRFPEEVLTAAVFSAIMLLNGLLMAGNAAYLSRHGELHGHAAAHLLNRRAAFHVVSFVIVGAVAVLAAAWHHPLIGAAVWAAAPLGFASYHAAYTRYADASAPDALGEES